MFSWKSLVLHHQQLFVLMLQREQDLPPNQQRGPSGATLLPRTNLPVLPPALFLKPEMPPVQRYNPIPQTWHWERKEGHTALSAFPEGFFIHPQGS